MQIKSKVKSYRNWRPLSNFGGQGPGVVLSSKQETVHRGCLMIQNCPITNQQQTLKIGISTLKHK